MKNKVFVTVKKELRAIVRDKKSLLMMLLTPLMIPAFILLFSFIYDGIMQEPSEEVEEPKYTIGINYDLSEEEKQIIEVLSFSTEYYGTENELKEAYDNNNIDAYITVDKNNSYKIYFNMDSAQSSSASALASEYLNKYNDYLASIYLNEIGADPMKVYNNVSYTYEELTGSSDLIDSIINLGFVFAIMSITLTAIYSATDSTAGEKERGTLETLLTFPLKNEELIKGKYLAITISCLITSVLSTILVVSSLLLSSKIFSIYENIYLNINFVTVLIGLLVMFAYSLFISGLCIAIASFTKTYKEAQSALTPVSLVTVVPMFMDIMEVELTPVISLIPIVNHVMLLETIFCQKLTGNDIINIAIMFISTIIYSIIIIKLITKMYKSEKILFAE